MTTETITIVVTEKGARVVKRNIEDIGASAEKSSKGVGMLKGALAGIATYFGGREILRFVDSIAILQTQLRNVTSSTAEYTRRFDSLFQIAQRTGGALGDLVDTYVRLNGALPDSIRKTTDLTKVTELLSRGLAISGTSAQVAGAVMTQLSQGLSGNFANAAQELNSLIEGAPLLARIISEQLGGKASTDLKKMAEAGKLTSRTFLDALLAAEKTINGYDIPPTIERSWQRVKNAIMEMGVQSSALRSGAAGLASIIDALSRNVDVLAVAIGLAAAAWTGYWIAVNIGAWSTLAVAIAGNVVAFFQLAAGVRSAAGAVALLSAATMANPVGLLVAGIAAAVTLMYLFKDQVLKLGDVIYGVFKGAGEVVETFVAKARVQMYELVKAIPTRFLPDNFDPKSLLGSNPEEAFNAAGKTVGDSFNKGFEEAQKNGLFAKFGDKKIELPPEVFSGGGGSDAPGKGLKETLERQKDLLEQIKAPMVDYKNMVNDLDVLYRKGKISLAEYTEQMAKAREQFLQAQVPTTIAQGFEQQIESMGLASRNVFGQIGQDIAKIFGPGGTLEEGLSAGMSDAIAYGKKWSDVLKDVARQILSQVIPALLRAVMIQSSASGGGGGGGFLKSIFGAVFGAFGGGGSYANTGFGSTFGNTIKGGMGYYGPGFASGGYTGNIATDQIAGVVHGQEFVMNAGATRRNLPALQAMNSGKSISGGNQNLELNVEINNQIPDATYEVNQIDETRVEIIARRIVAEDAPSVIAGDLSNANGKTSKAMSKYTQSGRRRN